MSEIPYDPMQQCSHEGACNLIDRRALLEKKIRIPIARIVTEDKVIYRDVVFVKDIEALPPAEPVKAYTKADYIMALHKEYGCTLTMAEEAHNKALEHLRSKARMKG